MHFNFLIFSIFFLQRYVTDGTVAIFMSTLFFVIPSRLDCSCLASANDEHDEEAEEVEEGKVLLHSEYLNRTLCHKFKLGLKPDLLDYLFYKGEKQKNDKKKKLKGTPTLLNWNVVHERMPWNIVLLLGGGFALAKGSEVR